MIYLKNNDQLVIIPAFNEEKNIEKTLGMIPKYLDVVVIDDGSTDSTKDLCLGDNIEVVSHRSNLGYEAALMTGLSFFKNKKYSRFVVIDADGEIDPTDAINALENINSDIHLVCGVRTCYKGRVSEQIANKISSKLFGIEDVFCGCKAMSATLANNFEDAFIVRNAFTSFAIHIAKRKQIINHPVGGQRRQGVSRYGSGLLTEIIILYKFAKSIFA